MSNGFGSASGGFRATSRSPFPWLHAVLFLSTCVTTTIVGAFLTVSFEYRFNGGELVTADAILTSPGLLALGIPFSFCIMAILLSHEMGHYLACRYYGVDASLPYFIPFIPLPPGVGTMGAFIRIRSPIYNRSALLDIGVAGPIAGFVVAIPVLIAALLQSHYVPRNPAEFDILLGDPLILRAFQWVLVGPPPPGQELYLHPVGMAAWFGFFATAVNLIPVGQLDGGHITYALFPRWHRRIAIVFALCLLPLGWFYWTGWFVWSAIIALLGWRHPQTMDDEYPINRRHVWLGWAALAMFVCCFMPEPIRIL